MSEEILTNGILTLAGKIKLEEETSQLKLILVDHIKNVKERPSSLDLFDDLKQSQDIKIGNVDIIYEILNLMGKTKLWTEFCKDMLIENPYQDYDVKKNSKCFTKFRLMMIEIGNNLTSSMVANLKMAYDIREDFSNEWMLLLHLEQHIHVDQDNQRTIATFAKNLRSANCPKGEKIAELYVTQTRSAVKECDFKTSTRKHTGSSESKTKSTIMKQVEYVEDKADRLFEQLGIAKNRVEDTSRQAKNDLNALKKKIDDYLEECEIEIEERKASKIQELEKTSLVIVKILENVCGLKKDIEQADAEQDLERFADLKLHVKGLDETLNGVCPDSVGYFECIHKNVSVIFNELTLIMGKQKALYVDYMPVVPRQCKLNTDKLLFRCFDVGEIIELRVDLMDTYGNESRVEQEQASITVHIKDLINPDDFKIIDQKVTNNVHKIKCKFASPGEWTVEVKVFGKLIWETFKLKVSPKGSKEKKVMGCGQTMSRAAIFDITFTADGQNLLACNNTNQVLLFDLSGNIKTFCELEADRKLVNLCCIANGTVFLTDGQRQEIVVLESDGALKRSFGKNHFQKSSPQGIAAIMRDNQVHVFTSNQINKRLDYFIDGTYSNNITSVGEEKRTLDPWFLAVNSKFQLLICNSDGYFLDILDMNQYQNDKLVHSIFCDSSVCVDEHDNIFLGHNSEILMYRSNFTFVQRFKCGDKRPAIYGIAARFGHLAVVHPGEIRLFTY
ncbi:uncharacterized protein LOC117116327 [Anneissia japonica]|uniref:uncharacterized protein LOC117116327 n=1 Tax=Anneissia japonica TaxID=1529436 RepID=UPI001425AA5C|nr:uncharacterized protein LOC117116327 [Anneissia japonica]XP_033116235.1 uncharacterized protein LOC117116327 [Anneissia japonica]